MRRSIATLAAACAALTLAATPVQATTLNGKGYETGELMCSGNTYTVLATGFGAAFRVTDTTGVLVFHSGSLTNVATGETLTFVANGEALGRDDVTCTGLLTSPSIGAQFYVVFRMAISRS
jgi:hypothetical protein